MQKKKYTNNHQILSKKKYLEKKYKNMSVHNCNTKNTKC